MSEPCKKILDRLGGYHLESRGITEVKGKGDMSTYWLTGQDLTQAKLRALSRKGKLLSNRSYTSSVQDLDFFNPKLSSRRGSSRISYREPLSPAYAASSALACAINSQLVTSTKRKKFPFYKGLFSVYIAE